MSICVVCRKDIYRSGPGITRSQFRVQNDVQDCTGDMYVRVTFIIIIESLSDICRSPIVVGAYCWANM